MCSHPAIAMSLLVAAAVTLDAGVVGDQTLGRRAINMLDPDARSRLNGLFVGVFFVGGSCGRCAVGRSLGARRLDRGMCVVHRTVCAGVRR